MNRPPTSTSHHLSCRMQAEPAALERLCQVTRTRGFCIDQMAVSTEAGTLMIEMVVSGERSIEMLRKQLQKLHTVRASEITSSSPVQQSVIVSAPDSDVSPSTGTATLRAAGSVHQSPQYSNA